MDANELRELAAQLSRPHDKRGLEVADMMHASNIGMTRNSIDNLNLETYDSVLEIGHGNGAHLPLLFEKSDSVQYTGFELSMLMHEEAIKANKQFLGQQARFILGTKPQLPFDSKEFSKIFTVNTLYFWEEPLEFLNDCYRVMKAEGLFCVTFAHKDFMEKLPFTKYIFKLYSVDDFKMIVEKSEFKIQKIDTQTEFVTSKDGQQIERTFSSVVLKK